MRLEEEQAVFEFLDFGVQGEIVPKTLTLLIGPPNVLISHLIAGLLFLLDHGGEFKEHFITQRHAQLPPHHGRHRHYLLNQLLLLQGLIVVLVEDVAVERVVHFEATSNNPIEFL